MPEDEVMEAWRGSVVHAAERMGLLPVGAGPSFMEFVSHALTDRNDCFLLRSERSLHEFSGWSNMTVAPPFTVAALRDASQRDTQGWEAVADAAIENRPWRWPEDEAVEGDNVTRELLALVNRGDEVGFRALAGCVMPADEVDDCWWGARARLGLLP